MTRIYGLSYRVQVKIRFEGYSTVKKNTNAISNKLPSLKGLPGTNPAIQMPNEITRESVHISQE